MTRLLKEKIGLGTQIEYSVLTWIQNITLTQWLTLVIHPYSAPWDNPTLMVGAFWSLNYEEQFYIIVGFIVIVLFSSLAYRLFFIFLFLGLAVIWKVIFPSTYYGLFIEYWVHFGIGCLLYYRLCGMTNNFTRITIDGCIIMLMVSSIIVLWLPDIEHRVEWVAIEWLVCSLFALICIILRPFDSIFIQLSVGRYLMALGLISYSLYLINQFNLRLAKTFSMLLLPDYAPNLIRLTVQVIILVGVATLFWYFFERPFLNNRATPSAIGFEKNVEEY